MKEKDLALLQGVARFGFSFALYRLGPSHSVCTKVWAYMNGNTYDHVDERRAAALLGMPQSELRRYSRASGLGHVENEDQDQRVFFTYEELRRICLLAAQSSK